MICAVYKYTSMHEGAALAKWWEHSPPTDVVRVRFWAWTIRGLGLLLVLPLLFPPGTPVFPSPRKPAVLNLNSTRNARTHNTWASGSGDWATTPRVIELKQFDLILILILTLIWFKVLLFEIAKRVYRVHMQKTNKQTKTKTKNRKFQPKRVPRVASQCYDPGLSL